MLIDIGLRCTETGLAQGTSGNLSERTRDGFRITASGASLANLTATELIFVNMDGHSTGQRATKPSSEWQFHRDIYRARADVHGIVHVHSPFATALACLGKAMPPFHYMIAITGRTEIPCAPYALFGTGALSANVVAALGHGYACLLANHGLVTAGRSVEHAFEIALEVEHLAQVYLAAKAAGDPVLLSVAQMNEALERFKTYGAHSAGDARSDAPAGGTVGAG
jgi:L-fuculose-phosphate aldolase